MDAMNRVGSQRPITLPILIHQSASQQYDHPLECSWVLDHDIIQEFERWGHPFIKA